MNRLALIAVLSVGCSGVPEKSVYDLSADDFAERRQELATVQADAYSNGDCVPVKEGDILLVTASGSLSSE